MEVKPIRVLVTPDGASVSYARHKAQNKKALDSLNAICEECSLLRDLVAINQAGEP